LSLDSQVKPIIIGGPVALAKSLNIDFLPAYPTPAHNLDAYNLFILSDICHEAEFNFLLEKLKKRNKKPGTIFVSQAPSVRWLSALTGVADLYAVAPSWDEGALQDFIARASQSVSALGQAQIASLIEDDVGEVLDQKDNEKKLERSLKRVQSLNQQMESLRQALIAIHMANTVGEVERLLNEALRESMGLSWVRIFFRWHEHIEEQLARVPELKNLKAPLVIGSRNLGQIVFARNLTGFSRAEEDIIQQVAEGVAMAVDRLLKLDQAEDLKREWESTFDAISEPLCLTDEHFVIQRTNKAFSQITGIAYNNLLGTNCFEAFIGQTMPARVLDSNPLKVERYTKDKVEAEIYSVTTQKIRTPEGEPKMLLVLFRNITEQQKLEKKMFESAKMAELGTVGSSIAHELNNPLGGVLSFIQLIKMDSPQGDPIRQDIIEMERGALRSKEIIENLLGFTRRPDDEHKTEYFLYEVIQQALRVVEIKTSSLGIRTKIDAGPQEIFLIGHPGLMTQAISHLLQNSVDAILQRSSADPRFVGELTIYLKQEPEHAVIEIVDNGVSERALKLTLAQQILDEHGGRVEISSQPNIGNVTKVTLSNV
jgi:PAS domain S-box-containing protein